MTRPWAACAAAVQFLTRIPVPSVLTGTTSLIEAAPYFPLVGALLGLAAGMFDRVLRVHIGVLAAAGFSVLLLVVLTGGLHEDGLADCADGCGGHTAEHRLQIMRDSHIGSYGAIAITLSVLLRTALIAALPADRVLTAFVCAEVLSRWTVLPLAFALHPARPAGPSSGQGARLARRLSGAALLIGTLIAVAICGSVEGTHCIASWIVALVVTAASGGYFHRRLGGITGDAFGATVQVTAVALYACNLWR
jgi:adenosylcobinamide-GDP ribazoletransferase